MAQYPPLPVSVLLPVYPLPASGDMLQDFFQHKRGPQPVHLLQGQPVDCVGQILARHSVWYAAINGSPNAVRLRLAVFVALSAAACLSRTACVGARSLR